MSAIATMVAATVDQQNSAVTSIAEGVSRASGEARVGAEAMSRVAGVTTNARSTASSPTPWRLKLKASKLRCGNS